MSPGDHRAGVIDLDLAALIGKPCQKIIRPKAHRLTCAIPSSQDSYNQLFLQSSQRHLLLPKLHALFLESSLPTFAWNSFGPHIEALDTLKSQCMKHAEKHCQKLHMGQVPFSPDLMKHYFLQQLWLLVWHKKAGHHISSTKIHHLSKKCALPLASQASLAEAEANYQSASLQYQQLKPMATKLQVNFLHHCSLEPHHSDQHLKAVQISSTMKDGTNPTKQSTD